MDHIVLERVKIAAEPIWKQSEISWIILAVAGPPLLRHLRSWINYWRLYRRCQKYPQIVVCKRTPLRESSKNATLWGSAAFGALLTFIVCFPLKIVQVILSLWKLIFEAVKQSLETPIEDPPSSARPSVQSETASTASTASGRSSLKRGSALRKGGESCSSSFNSRVVFVEHSNGSVKTENYYYDPQTQPGVLVNATASQTPEKSRTPDQSFKLRRIQTPPPPPRQVILSRRIEVVDDKENSSIRTNEKKKRPIITTQRRLSKTETMALVAHRPPINTASLSEQMRKRRLEGHDMSITTHATKRPNHGRVALGSLRPRVVSTRAILTKRERETREEKILSDMNRKRAKVNASAISPPPASNQNTPIAKAALQFGSCPPAGSVATPVEKHSADPTQPGIQVAAQFATATPVSIAPASLTKPAFSVSGVTPPPAASGPPASGFSFGSTSVPAAAPPPPSADPAKQSSSFGGAQAPGASTPAQAAVSSDASNTAFSTGIKSVSGPGSTAAISFGSTAAPASTAIVPTPGFSFGGTPAPGGPTVGGAPPLVGYGAEPNTAAQQQQTVSGASARRRAKARQGRRR